MPASGAHHRAALTLAGVEVQTATRGDRDAVGNALATAFAADPVVRWLLPNPSRDARMFRALATHLHAAPGCADIALAHGAVVGAALWDPPGHRLPAGRRVVGYASLLIAMGWSGLMRGGMLEAAFARARPAERVWYLAQLGATRPGLGVGSALLEHRLARISGPAYLESSNKRNVPLYERFGFEVVREIVLPQDGPTLWTMMRS